MRTLATRHLLPGASIVGAVLGVVLYVGTGPLPLLTSAPLPSPSATSPRPTPSPSGPSPAPTGTPGPPFTRLALLQPQEFEEFGGWGKTVRVRSWDTLPPTQVSTCTTVRPSDGPVVAAYAAVSRGVSTTAAEIVVRYPDEHDAALAAQRISARIATCEDQPGDGPDLEISPLQSSPPDDLDRLDLWDTTGGRAEGAVAFSRGGDRISLLTLLSQSTDPLTETDVPDLARQAGRRLN